MNTPNPSRYPPDAMDNLFWAVNESAEPFPIAWKNVEGSESLQVARLAIWCAYLGGGTLFPYVVITFDADGVAIGESRGRTTEAAFAGLPIEQRWDVRRSLGALAQQ